MGKKQKKLITSYIDLQSEEHEKTLFFFLDHLLRARIDLHLETGNHDFDQEVNMYLAYLLQSFLTTKFDISEKPYLSPFDVDVRRYINDHPGLRDQYIVYKDNADFNLVYDSIFMGFHHEGSYHDIVLSEEDLKPRIAQYYALAASALGHLRGMQETLVQVLYALSEQIKEITVIIRKVGGDCFDFIEQLSTGSFFHLQKAILEKLDQTSYKQKIDLFLELFKKYKAKSSLERKEKLLQIIDEIKVMNPHFSFDLGML